MSEPRSHGPAKLRLQAISYSGLLGNRSGTIELDSDLPTVLTGANGTGKSTILRLISSASRPNIPGLLRAPVKEFRMIFDSGDDLVFTRINSDHGRLSWGPQNQIDITYEGINEGLSAWAQDMLEELDGLDPDYALELISEMAIDRGRSEEVRRIRNFLMHGATSPSITDSQEWIAQLRASFNVLHVSDQRIVRPTDFRSRQYRSHRPLRGLRTGTQFAVEHASQEIADLIERSLLEYSERAQSLDRSLPNDLISALENQAPAIDHEGLKSLLEKTELRRAALSEVGLLDNQRNQELNVSDQALHEEGIRRVVHAVLESNMQKFAGLERLRNQLSTFKSFLDSHLDPKSVAVDRRHGLRFKLADGETITPRQLSSGEQQITVLAYEVIFKAGPGTLVLIDEPELSLHVNWQATLLQNLVDMAKASGTRFLLATHSIAIVAESSSLERSLDVNEVSEHCHY